MGVYALVERKMVNRRAVWEKQGGADNERFLYYACNGRWMVSIREHMEAGAITCYMDLPSTALTPDQARPSEVWKVGNSESNPEIQVRRQQ
jgi:hypothetical protein